MKRLKKGIFPLIIGVHIMLRLVFSDTFTNDEMVTETAITIPFEPVAQKPVENVEFSIKKSNLASIEEL